MAGDMIHGHVIHCIFLPLDAFTLIPVLITLDSRFISQIRDGVTVTIVGVGVGVVGVGENATVVTVGGVHVADEVTVATMIGRNSSLVSPYRWFKVCVVS